MKDSLDFIKENFEDMMADAGQKVRMLSKEWSAEGLADPGVHIMENLTAFTLLQLHQIDSLTEEMKLKILEVAGYRPGKTYPARLFLSPQFDYTDLHFAKAHKFFLDDDICFETADEVHISGGQMLGIYSASGKAIFEDFSGVTEAGEMILLFDRLGKNTRILHIRIDRSLPRNPIINPNFVNFCRIEAYVFTSDGWERVPCEDTTGGLAVSGVLYIDLEKVLPEQFEFAGCKGEALKLVLKDATFDYPPKIEFIRTNLFEVLQKDTLARCEDLRFEDGTAHVRTENFGDIIQLYAGYGKNDWIQLAENEDYEMETSEEDGLKLTLLKMYDNQEVQGELKFKILMCSPGYIDHRYLGIVEGYDGEGFFLSPFTGVLNKEFSVMLKWNEDGEERRQFFEPEENGEDDFCYHIDDANDFLVVDDAGDFVGAELYVVHFATTKGRRGNIREGNTLTSMIGNHKREFINFSPGRKGRLKENATELEELFREGQGVGFVLSSLSDYSNAVMKVSGLAIKKVHSYLDSEGCIHICVMRNSVEKFPDLGSMYEDRIKRYIEPRRMLGTKVKIESPIYVPVHIDISAYVNSEENSTKAAVENALRSAVDRCQGDGGFGKDILHSEIFSLMSALPMVESISALSVRTDAVSGVSYRGRDLILEENALSYAGDIHINLSFVAHA